MLQFRENVNKIYGALFLNWHKKDYWNRKTPAGTQVASGEFFLFYLLILMFHFLSVRKSASLGMQMSQSECGSQKTSLNVSTQGSPCLRQFLSVWGLSIHSMVAGIQVNLFSLYLLHHLQNTGTVDSCYDAQLWQIWNLNLCHHDYMGSDFTHWAISHTFLIGLWIWTQCYGRMR